MKKNPMIRFKDVKRMSSLKKMSLAIFGLIAIVLCVGMKDADFSKFKTSDVVTAVSVCALPLFTIKGEFKELTGSDWDTFKTDASAEELADYFNAKNDDARKKLNSLIEAKASKEEIDTMKASLIESQNEQYKQLNETLKQYGLAIAKLSKEERSETNPTSDIRKELEKNVANLKTLMGDDKAAVKSGEFTMKVAGTMLESVNISGGNVPVEQRLAGLNVVPSRRVRLMDVFKKGKATSNIISWVYQANKDGAAGGTLEGATKNQIDFDLVVGSQALVKITAFIKVSTEMLDDIDFIETEIRNELMREVLKAVELTAFSGNGTAPNLLGVNTIASSFVAGASALLVDNANQMDVLEVAMTQILLAEQEPANAIFMNPADVLKIKQIKVSTTDRRYVDRLITVNGQVYLDGVPIYQTTLIPVGTYLVGNFDYATLYTKGGINIQVGLDGNDFTKNLRTILAEWRGALIVRNNDRSGFVKGTFSTNMAALETP